MRRLLSIALVIAAAVGASRPAAAEELTEKTFITNARQLIFEGRRSGEGYFSPDGTMMIFQAEREDDNPFYQIYILSLETGDVHRVSNGVGKTTCSFFRPGTNRVLYASTHLDPDARKKQQAEFEIRRSGTKRRYAWDYDTYFDIFSANQDGSEVKRLTDAEGYDAEGSYSPDGNLIAFCSMRNGYGDAELTDKDKQRLEIDPSYFGEIYIMNADGTGQKRLTDWPGYDGGPFFSPDGSRIIWRHFNEAGTMADIYTMKLDGSDRVRLTDFESMCWAPYYHPTGKYVIFTTNKLGFSNFELYIVDPKGEKEPVRVTYTDRFDGLPVFSPDGNTLAWTATRADGGKATQIFMGGWDHEAALEALAASPKRAASSGRSATEDSRLRLPLSEALAGYSKSQPSIKSVDLAVAVSYLASDELEGRLVGSEGARKAGEFIDRQFENAGLAAAGEEGLYYQEFPFSHGKGYNVFGYIPAGSGDDSAPVVVIGAHYDHIGLGHYGMAARPEEVGQVHNGADNNASGTALLMEMAGALREMREESPDRFKTGILVAAWSGAEINDTGSGYWMDHPTVDLGRVLAYVNFDMVGRMQENTLYVAGTGSSDGWKRMLEKRNVAAGFNIQTGEGIEIPTDMAVFYGKQIPAIGFTTGPNEDTNTATDDADKLDYDAMARIGDFAVRIVMDLVSSGQPMPYVDMVAVEKERSEHNTGRPYLGTVPDYAGKDGEGVKLTDVTAGSPAEKGGLKPGDIIVRFAGRTVGNIQDYADALDDVKVGEPVEVVVLRGGKEVTVTVVPASRD